MQAITVKYLRPTNRHGARLKASCYSGSITVPYPYDLPHHLIELSAAKALLHKLEWKEALANELVGGRLPDGDTMVFCFTTSPFSSH